MNREFTRYQKLPTLDALRAPADPVEIGVRTNQQTIARGCRPLFLLPEGEGQGEGNRTDQWEGSVPSRPHLRHVGDEVELVLPKPARA